MKARTPANSNIWTLMVEAKSLELPRSEHPNKHYFSGILTKVGVPSDSPPNGSGGKRILLTKECAEAAIDSLLGMGIDLAQDLRGHDAKSKIGLITEAHIDGNDLKISGFLYAADFPEETLKIHLQQAELGFSFEARNLGVTSVDDDPLIVNSCIFTGAAVLFKNSAAYKTTAIAAAKAKEHEMTEVQQAVAAAMEAALGPVTKTLEAIAAGQAALTTAQAAQAAAIEELRTSPPVAPSVAAAIAKISPHVAAIEAAVAQMEKDGVGSAAQIAGLRRLATSWKQDANLGRMPADTDIAGFLAASAAPLVQQPAATVKVEDSAEFKAMKAAHDKEVADAKDASAALETKFKDLEAKFNGVRPPPQRQTLDASVLAALSKHGLETPEEGKFLSLAKIDAAMEGMDIGQRMHFKTRLAREGLLSPNGAA